MMAKPSCTIPIPGFRGRGRVIPRFPRLVPVIPPGFRRPARPAAPPARQDARQGPGRSRGRPGVRRWAPALSGPCGRPVHGPVGPGGTRLWPIPPGPVGESRAARWTGGGQAGAEFDTGADPGIAPCAEFDTRERCGTGRFPRAWAGPNAESDAQPRRIRCASPRNPRRLRCASPQSPMPIHAEPYARPPHKPLLDHWNSSLHIIPITDSLRVHD